MEEVGGRNSVWREKVAECCYEMRMRLWSQSRCIDVLVFTKVNRNSFYKEKMEAVVEKSGCWSVSYIL